MATIMRKCTKCGRPDASRTWPSTDRAAESNALDGWMCPWCAWPDGELIDADETEVEAGSATPA